MNEHIYAVETRKRSIKEIRKIRTKNPHFLIMSEAIMSSSLQHPSMGYAERSEKNIYAPYHTTLK